MTRCWFNTPLELHRRWTQTRDNRSKQQHNHQLKNERSVGGHYKLLHEIGYGASGIVHLAIDTKTNVKYAIKELSKSKLQRLYHSEILRQSGPAKRRSRLVSSISSSSSSTSSLDEALPSLLGVSKRRKLNEHINSKDKKDALIKEFHTEEVNILKSLAPHKNIIKFIEVIDNDPESNDSIFIVMEYAQNGIVMDVMPHSIIEPYSDLECRRIFKQLVEAVDHLHHSGVIHKDIKPQNLMLSSNNRVKLIDFSNATFVSDTRSYSSTGTPAFMAPELLKKVPRDQIQSSPTSSDLWSMGITLYCLAYGHLPFEKSSLLDLYEDIQTKSVPHSSSNKIDLDLVDVIDKLLEKNPVDRITLKDVKLHPWMNK